MESHEKLLGLHEADDRAITAYAIGVIGVLVDQGILPQQHLQGIDNPAAWFRLRGLKMPVLRCSLSSRLGLADKKAWTKNPDHISVPARNTGVRDKEHILKTYGQQCIITGCTVLRVLIAAHIMPRERFGSDGPENVIPLRADIDKLFECIHGAPLISIHPMQRRVVIADQLKNGEYAFLEGLPLAPNVDGLPSKENLDYHFDIFSNSQIQA